jgi:predicted amidohydrolase YtcJ
VTRRTLDGAHPDGWIPAQKITVEEALRAYTTAGAFAQFEENEKGTLATGKLADFVLIDHDLTRMPPETLRDARVLMTVVGGRVVYDAR